LLSPLHLKLFSIVSGFCLISSEQILGGAMKHKLLSAIIIGSLLVPASSAFGFLGFGVYVGSDQINIDETISQKTDGVLISEVTQYPFDGTGSFGGYLYIDVLPIVDLEIEYQLSGGMYKYNYKIFEELTDVLIKETGKQEFIWGKGSAYFTVRKKIFGAGIPILGGVKFHAGGGINVHNYTPLMDIKMIEDMRGDVELYESFVVDDMTDYIIEYMKENMKETTGFHVQAGAQVSFLTFDLFLNYRYTLAELFPGKPGYSSLNLMFGLGF